MRRTLPTVIALALATHAHAQVLSFSDQTAASQIDAMYQTPSGTISLPQFMLAGGAVGDFDRDGDPDVFILSGGHAPDRLYINNGDGTFTDQAAAWGVDASHVGGSASVADYDNDGDLDLFVTGWMDEINGDRLFRNNGPEGGYTFTDVTDVLTDLMSVPVFGFTPAFQDTDGDRYPELLIAADFSSSQYLRNDAGAGFTNVTAASGTGLDENGMGATTGDFNNDGLVDWYVTAIWSAGGNKLYMNQGEHVFEEVSVQAGVNQGGWGWGAAAVDIDNDADLDILETNGWNLIEDPSFLFLNNLDGTFTESGVALGMNHVTQGRSILLLDHDTDGDVDVLFLSHMDPAFLFRNDLTKDTGAGWLRVRLDNCGLAALTPDGVGAKLELTAGGVTQHRWISAASSYLGQGEMVAHFGVDDATTVDELRVTWPSGFSRVLSGLDANQSVVVTANRADVGAPWGVLDIADASAFLDAWTHQRAEADLAPPQGRFDYADIMAFLVEFASGCRE